MHKGLLAPVQLIKYRSSRLETWHSLGKGLAMHTAGSAGSLPALESSVMPWSQVRLSCLVLEKHVHELEDQVKKTVLRLSPSAPSPLPSPACRNQSWPPLCCWSCLDRRSGGVNLRMHTDQGKTASTTMRQPSFMPEPQISKN